MRRVFLLSAAVAIGCCSVAASGEAVNSIQFADGNVLDIQGVVGSGPNTAYLAVDFSNNAPVGPAFAWEYQWTGTESEADMLNAVEAADTSLTTSQDSGFILNFNYGSNTGSAQPFASDNYTYWSSYLGPYDSTAKTVDWVYAPDGIDDLTLGDLYDDNGNLLGSGEEGLFYGWTINGEYQTTNLTPNLPETSVPEPSAILLGSLVLSCLLIKRPTRRAQSQALSL